MNHLKLIRQNFSNLVSILNSFTDNDLATIEKVGVSVAKSLASGGTVFWCGNGGSAADAQHLSAELIGRLVNNRHPLSSVALNSDIAALTCIANDFGYADIYSRQLEGLAQENDVAVVLSTSGESENIIRCILKAKEIKATSVALLGKGGGSAKSLADFEIIINSKNTARIQEVHKLVGHTICQIIEQELGYQN